MSDVKNRLTKCFQVVFPDLAEASIPGASSDTVAAWDSLAAITLLQVVQEEFGVEIDLERLSELGSYRALSEYLAAQVQ